MSWQDKCSQRMSISLEGDKNLEKKALNEIEMDQYIDRISDQKFMFSEITYADETDIGKPNHNENRIEEAEFFEIITKDGKIRYRSGKNLNDLLSKYGYIKSIRQISQAEYTRLRLKANNLGEDDL